MIMSFSKWFSYSFSVEGDIHGNSCYWVSTIEGCKNWYLHFVIEKGHFVGFKVVFPNLVHLFLWTDVSQNIIIGTLQSHGQWNGTNSPDLWKSAHRINWILLILFVHCIHNAQTTLSKQSGKSILVYILCSYVYLINNILLLQR